jgi:hypothetical protein
MGAQQIKRFRRDLESGERQIRRGLHHAANRGGQRYETKAKRAIIEQDAVASTELFRGIESQAVRTTGTAVTATLRSRAPHSGYVEHGTGAKGDGTYPRPGNPSPVDIAQWMVQKPTINAGEHLWPRAEFIANRISEQGVDAQPFFHDAVESGHFFTVQSLKRLVDDALGISIGI